MNTSVNESAVNRNPDDRSAWLLLDELRQRLDSPDLEFVKPPQRLSGGFWAEMFVLHLVGSHGDVPPVVVARIAPDPDLSARETTVQSGVAAQGFPTPRIHVSGGPDGAVGRSWSLMDLAPGLPLLDGLSGVSALVRLPRLATRLPDQLARITSQLHHLDPAPIRAGLEAVAGRPVGIDGLLDHLVMRAALLDDARIDAALSQLQRTRPEPTNAVVCHGDLHPFNVLAEGDRLTLLDWTGAQITDPAYDVAFTALIVSTAPLDAPAPLRPVITAAARWVARRFLNRYEHHSGTRIDPRRLDWHRTLHATRILSEVAEWRVAAPSDRREGHPWHALESAMQQVVDSAFRD